MLPDPGRRRSRQSLHRRQRGEYDLAGCIVGVVDHRKMIDGSRIKPGDVIYRGFCLTTAR